MYKKADSEFYHEKQSTMKCAIHAVNNLLRSPRYKKEDFDRIAKDLYDKEQASKSSEIYINPYKNIFGLVKWEERRKRLFLRDLFKIVQPNHWFSILKSEDAYFNVDSRLDEPQKFRTQGDFIKLMKDVQNNEGFIFPVYRN